MLRWVKRLAVVLVIILPMIALAPPSPVQAHAAFDRANPEPNSVLPEHVHEVTIWFTEPLEPQFSEIQVLDSLGQGVDSGNSRVLDDDPMALSVSLPTLPDGTYTVAWRNVSTVDGHTLRGSYVFSFGQAMSGAATEEASSVAESAPLDPLARTLVLFGALALTGGLLFERLIITPVFLRADKAPEVFALGKRLVRRSRRIMWLALAVFALASVYQLAGQAATLFNVPLGEVQSLYMNVILRTTDWGGLWLWRMWLFSILAIYMVASALIAAPEQEEDGNEDLVTRIAGAMALLASLGILLALSLSSHAAAMGPLRVAAVFSDYLHLLASAVWVGGLFHFAIAVRPVFQLDERHRGALLAAVVPRFSTVAILSVGTLIITGLYSAWAQVAILPALTTPYGLTLLGKLALFAPLLALGALNLLRIGPRLRRDEQASGRLRRTVSLEALLGLAILITVGLLTGMEPARQVAAREGVGQERALTFEDSVEGSRILLTLEPALTGRNTLSVRLRDALDRPIGDATEVLVELSYLDTDLGPTAITLQPGAEEGEYLAADVLFSVAGNWQAAVLVQRPDAFDSRAAFRFDVRAGQTIEVSTQVGFVLWGIELVLLGALFGGVSLPLGSWRTKPGLALAAPGAVLLALGIGVAFGAPALSASMESGIANPFPPTPESLAVGQEVYANSCGSCHGAEGIGDGSEGAGLSPPPADLTFHVPLHPDDELFTSVFEGKAGTAMPAFGDQLSEEEIWHLVNYLRTLPE